MSITPLNAGQAYADALARANGSKEGPAGNIAGAAEGPSFADLVRDVVEDSIASTREGEITSIRAAAKQADVVDVVTAVANAEMTLQTVVAVRDQVVQAYQDIIRMPI